MLMKLKHIIAVTAFLVAGCAAFFSVKGIATLFSGAFISTLIMAGSIEIGKLVSVSFLKRHWITTSKLLKWYLSIAVVVLMFITSLGIFGFLSAAYKDSSLKNDVQKTQISNIEQRKNMIDTEIASLATKVSNLNDIRKQQESRLDSISNNIGKTVTAVGAEKLQDGIGKAIEKANDEITSSQNRKQKLLDDKIELDKQIMTLRLDSSAKDIQTFEYVANEIGMPLDSVVKWFIIIIIMVFDPLAIALVLAYNEISMNENIPEIKIDDIKITPIEEPKPTEKIEEPIVQNDIPTNNTPSIPRVSMIKTLSGNIKDANGNIIIESEKL